MIPLLELRGISKSFGPVLALDDVHLTVKSGQVHAIMGENGAGKSTLIRALSGMHSPTRGVIALDGEPVRLDTPKAATSLGIRTVFQELHVVPQLSVAENILLGAAPTKGGFIDRGRMHAIAQEVLDKLGVDLHPGHSAGALSRSQQQIIEICRALVSDARLLILDEPTASLGERESRQLLDIVRHLTSVGVAVIYVSHRMNEVLEIADEVTVLRDGKYVATHVTPVGSDQLIEDMIGRPANELYKHTSGEPGEALLKVENLSSALVHEVSLTVRAGEIVGIAGLIGSGKSEIARTIYGIERTAAGEVHVANRRLTGRHPAAMLDAGVAYYPSDRRREGLVMRRPLRESLSLGALRAANLTRGGVIRNGEERRRAEDLASRLSLRPPTVEQPAHQYSGGNQQKALLARGMLHGARIHLFDEPTVGIDIGAKADVYAQMDQYARAGAGVLVVSSDLTELIGISDRIYVVAEGRISAELIGEEISEASIAANFFPQADREREND